MRFGKNVIFEANLLRVPKASLEIFEMIVERILMTNLFIAQTYRILFRVCDDKFIITT